MSADGGIPFGSYSLFRRIARGGMAEVFLAQQRGVEGWGRRVAVKRILPHLSDSADFNRMFLAEARLAARLSHPNIVHIYDFGKVADDYFIAMEFVDGIHAGNLIKLAETERLPAALIARIGADAAAALHYAHGQTDNSGKALGLVHRDVSPANLMVSFDGVVKLVDFGIAKAAALSEGKTSPGVIKGKYAYMSPEQTIGAPLDGRSDVFSLAVCMWEMLSGRVIVERGNAADAMRAIRDGRLARLDQVAPWVPPPLTRAITWAMENKREARCTAAEFGQALEEYIKASPDIATPLQLGSWLRTRFASTATGPMAAMPDLVAGPDTRGASVASPGTAVAPGTAAGAGVGAVDEPTGRGAQTILDPPRTLGGARSEPGRAVSAGAGGAASGEFEDTTVPRDRGQRRPGGPAPAPGSSAPRPAAPGPSAPAGGGAPARAAISADGKAAPGGPPAVPARA
ncbi:MAG: serine/threonine protein kinase, partial [Kofleriaceae bacterium]|nr:serine/threonine protein kinase [Kofleriaceae bacterium]MBP9208398.1 serine/threonine protein kinase [Kofleriaceae bacterium]